MDSRKGSPIEIARMVPESFVGVEFEEKSTGNKIHEHVCKSTEQSPVKM